MKRVFLVFHARDCVMPPPTPYKRLQARAKASGIRANQPAATLARLLGDEVAVDKPASSSRQGAVDASLFSEDEGDEDEGQRQPPPRMRSFNEDAAVTAVSGSDDPLADTIAPVSPPTPSPLVRARD